ncbi:MAG: chromate resistance protein ChrB domain-containing protein [Gemmatimonadaceae bacterium]
MVNTVSQPAPSAPSEKPSENAAQTDESAAPWLVLLAQLPAKPDYERVKTWRRVRQLGAVTLKGGAHVLPNSDGSREDFAWLAVEIESAGGSAVLCEARMVSGISDGELRALFREQTDATYHDVAEAARAALGTGPNVAAARRARRQLDLARRRDHFAAAGHASAEHVVAQLEAAAACGVLPSAKARAQRGSALEPGTTWVTRAGVFVDRIASAWLIRRFIDPRARFKFVAGVHYSPAPNEVRFDMFDAEFTHRGDRCTFEVLLEHFKLEDPALAPIGEIVHDIDLKDAKFARPEADGIAQLLQGIAVTHADDAERLTAGAVIFESLYARFSMADR